MQFYKPFRKEEELFPEDYEACLELYNTEQNNIQTVKSLLLPHLEGVETGSELAEELLESKVGDFVVQDSSSTTRKFSFYS